MQIQANNLRSGGKETAYINEYPNECPLCHHKIRSEFINAYVRKPGFPRSMQIIFLCPENTCRELFIGSYDEKTASQFVFIKSEPKKIISVSFSDIIKTVSPLFSEIYNEAYTAEEEGLGHICGAGYRKALEFLVKDYLISQDRTQEEKIKKEQLGAVIKNRVAHTQLKEVAKRAVWLGNDEVHYERKWEDKDVKDLKILIDLAIRWIEMEKMTEQIMQDMPRNTK